MTKNFVSTLFAAALLFLLSAGAADAIPYWARKFEADCSLCHWHQPKLNSFGKKFQANGYRINKDDAPDSSPESLATLPASLKVEPRFVAGNKAKTSSDFQLHSIELQIGAALKGGGSVLIEKYLEERGDYHNAGDAFIRWPLADGLFVSFGQFTLMDHIPDGERITLNRNLVYNSRVSIGGKTNKFRLRDRQRGLSLAWSPDARSTVSLAVVNGNADAAETGDLADDNDTKNVHLNAWHDFASGYSLGLFAHAGESAAAGAEKNRFNRLGLTLLARPSYAWNVELITMLGRDDNLFGTPGAARTKSAAYSIEADHMFRDGFVGYARYGSFRTTAAGLTAANSVQSVFGISRMLTNHQKLSVEYLLEPGKDEDELHFEIEFNL